MADASHALQALVSAALQSPKRNKVRDKRGAKQLVQVTPRAHSVSDTCVTQMV